MTVSLEHFLLTLRESGLTTASEVEPILDTLLKEERAEISEELERADLSGEEQLVTTRLLPEDNAT